MNEENEYYEKCAAAIKMLKVFMEDAEQKLETSISLATLHLIVNTIDK